MVWLWIVGAIGTPVVAEKVCGGGGRRVHGAVMEKC